MHDRLRAAVAHRRGAIAMRRDVDEPRADTQSRLGRETNRARHPGAAAEQEQPAARALVRRPRPRRQRVRELAYLEPRERRLELVREILPAGRGRRARCRPCNRTRDRDRGLASAPTNVTVAVARIASPSGRPVSACRPLGISSARIGAPLEFATATAAAKSPVERTIGADAEQRVDDDRPTGIQRPLRSRPSARS